MDEFEIIRRYFSAGYPARDDVVLGVGDDAAITCLDEGERLVTASDALVAGTHFPTALAADAIAHRALAANLSDLAAMGATPRWFTLALALPAPDADWLAAFARGLQALAHSFGVALIGGDTVRGPLAVTITALGSLPADAGLHRDGARPGDGIYLTGDTGCAGWAWRAMADGQSLAADDPLYRRFAYPQPRVEEALSLHGIATAAIDLSDGLHVDLARLLSASGVGGEGELGRVPLAPDLRARVGDTRARDLALTGGDDYELCFTVPDDRSKALHARARSWGCGLTRIGAVTKTPGLRWQMGGKVVPPPGGDFRHF